MKPPSVESTALAWLCRVTNEDVHRAAQALGIPLSTEWYRSLTKMRRIAFALGLEVERVPARGAGQPPTGRLPGERGLLWAGVGDRDGRRSILWGVDLGTGAVAVRPHQWSVFDEDAPGVDGLAECTLLSAGMVNGLTTVKELVDWYAQPGCTHLRPGSWLVPVGPAW